MVFGGMLAIGLIGLLIVLISHCQRDEPYLDSQGIEQGNPDRVVPPPQPNVEEIQRRSVTKPAPSTP